MQRSARSRRKASERGKLVKKYWERKEAENYRRALGRDQRGTGIYVLYDDESIYYIGLSKSSLRARLRRHATRDRHKGKWTHFSFYQIGRRKFIKDVESLLIRVCDPPGNRVRGRFKRENDLDRSAGKGIR